MKPTLFFSHSSHDSEACARLVQALEADHALRMCFDVRDLAAGRGWREQLGPWLRDCSGGIVRITQAVLDKHDWVLQEATLLAFRAQGEGDAFRLFIVADDEARADARFGQLFGAVGLDRFQFITVPAGAAWDDEAPRLAATIRAEMAKVEPFHDDFHSRLAELLFDTMAPLDGLESARRLLHDGWDADGTAANLLADPRRVLRAVVARRLAHADFGHWHDIQGLFQQLAPVAARSLRQELRSRLRSWWVALDHAERLAAARIARYRHAPPPGNVVLLAADSEPEAVAEGHAHRRFLPYRGCQWLALGAPETEADTLAALCAGLRGPAFCDDPEASPHELVQQLADDRRRNRLPVVVHLHLGPSAEHVRRAARLYWPCIFVLTAPQRHAAALAQALGVAPVLPPAGGPAYPQALKLNRRAERTDELPGALA
ncbi:MAG: toll/interleukin-1 receptor domain-containing protein [Burkholderiaceae bacterium]|nr:toll/interleukin-1 receptor domain-containing protein [Burkholderiaceae bacterium]